MNWLSVAIKELLNGLTEAEKLSTLTDIGQGDCSVFNEEVFRTCEEIREDLSAGDSPSQGRKQKGHALQGSVVKNGDGKHCGIRSCDECHEHTSKTEPTEGENET